MDLFPRPSQQKFKSCPACSALNISSAVSCNSCGASFQVGFVLTLDEALRAGAIIRGIDIEEDEVQLGEEMAAPVRERILRSGDEQLVRILRDPTRREFCSSQGYLIEFITASVLLLMAGEARTASTPDSPLYRRSRTVLGGVRGRSQLRCSAFARHCLSQYSRDISGPSVVAFGPGGARKRNLPPTDAPPPGPLSTLTFSTISCGKVLNSQSLWR